MVFCSDCTYLIIKFKNEDEDIEYFCEFSGKRKVGPYCRVCDRFRTAKVKVK